MSGLVPEPAQSPSQVVLALGSNLGDRAETLADAIRDLAALADFDLTDVSAVFESAAVKLDGVDEGAPRYLNLVLTGRYRGEPGALLDAVNSIERRHGRVRAERWGDRTLDIDIIAIDDLELDDPRLVLPHPRAGERDFVLAPWLQIDANAVLPGTGPGRGRIADLLAAMPNTMRTFDGDAP
jgi:2-amino-4-hydroxy-6-hydroxymethyldihydropteridine diphosphokinase